ncbi:related to ribosomal protein YmS2, mitochondrial [Ramularia collo-cygni]|uniref:Protein phosphatase methylesterase 1 n=1 Tax=Ramularia collo-cygni TaxID=112498 RepID=A0A2D3V1K9_9PEZI|nr:related to ribosomal protein YmS2, mitochondrial [Ramularia collo-cygni]CZT19350.1 related to ribosomal protein YmS2, mitochondrial [Ramularia collo-cygni]
MSQLFRQSMTPDSPEAISRPGPLPHNTHDLPTTDIDDHSSSSDSSASSAASAATVRPSSREQPAPAKPWAAYFDQELCLTQTTATQKATYLVYLCPPKNPSKDPLFVCHHGAGASALSFALFALELRRQLPTAGILSLSARGHGSHVTDLFGAEIIDFSLEALTNDALAMIHLTTASQSWPQIPPTILIGHSLGGAIVTTLSTTHFRSFGSNLIGYCVLDVVEGSAIEALGHMRTYLSSRPKVFLSVDEAIVWHTRTRTIRDQRSAEVSVPSILVPNGDGGFTWRTDLAATNPWWEEWFKGLSQKFLTGRGAKLLILAGTDRLDRELMIGQMQGKFQLVVIPEAGHFVQEDVAEKIAGLLVEFFKRNDRSQMVLPPKVSELLAQGKKV